MRAYSEEINPNTQRKTDNKDSADKHAFVIRHIFTYKREEGGQYKLLSLLAFLTRTIYSV